MTLPNRGSSAFDSCDRPAPSRDPLTSGHGDRTRRDLLAAAALGGLAGALGGAVPARADDPPPLLPGSGAPFTADTIPDIARALAKRAYVAPRTDDVPDSLRNLSREQYAAIRTAPGARIWEEAGLGFAIEPLHRGFVYTGRVALNLVEDGVVRPVPYDRARFDSGGFVLPELQDPGFSGFRLLARFGGGGLADFARFQGASFYNLLAAGQGWGVTARALTLRPADSRGEEFPQWRAFYIERPGSGGGPIVVHALVDSPSATAAFRMTLHPGDASIADVEGTIFARTTIDHLGLCGMQASFLFGPHDRRGADEARAAAYATGGLQIRNGGDEAIWRPVHNPETLQISSFVDDRPKGFGLMQRARDYAAFQDDVQHWEWRPSLWIEPLGSSGVEGVWGAGAVTLLEIPSDSEFNENVLAYWRPKVALPAASETGFSYRQVWCWQAPEPPPVASVTGTRSGRGSSGPRRLFLVDFTGAGLFAGEPDAGAEWQTVLIASLGTITRQTLFPYPERKTVRVAFELDPGGERACELRLALKRGDRQVTETWLYRWTP